MYAQAYASKGASNGVGFLVWIYGFSMDLALKLAL
jgi:hypothetical protein